MAALFKNDNIYLLMNKKQLTIEFINACKKNDFNTINNLINSGINFNNKDRESLFMEICLLDLDDKFSILLMDIIFSNNTIDTPFGNLSKMTPLMCACGGHGNAYRNINIVKQLLDYGADITIMNEYGITALTFACCGEKKSDTQIVKLLLEYGMDITLQDSLGETALTYANNVETIKLLLEYGADITVQNKNSGETVLMHAVTKNVSENINIIKLLLEYNINTLLRDQNGRTALMYACIVGSDAEIVKLLLEHTKKGINIQDIHNRTALIYASGYFYTNHISYQISVPKVNIIKLFLEHEEVDINVQDKTNNTALNYLANAIKDIPNEFMRYSINFMQHNILGLITNEQTQTKLINQITLKHQHNYNKIKTNKKRHGSSKTLICYSDEYIDLRPYFQTQRTQLNNILTTYIKQNRYMIDSYCTNIIFNYLYC